MNAPNDSSVLLSHGIVLPVSSYAHKTVRAPATLVNAVVGQQHQQQHEIVQASVATTTGERGGGGEREGGSSVSEIANANPVASDKASNLSFLCTPKKDTLTDNVLLQIKREQCNTPGVEVGPKTNELQMQSIGMPLDYSLNAATVTNILKNRYVICTLPNPTPSPPKTPKPPPTYYNSTNNSNNKSNKYNSSSSYQHNVISLSNLRCIDIYTGEQFLCKIINEPLHKVQLAYFKLQQSDNTHCCSQLFGHQLIRPVKDMIPLNSKRTYIISSMNNHNNQPNQEFESKQQNNSSNNLIQGVFEDLHSYVRDKRCLNEIEARSLFYQVCETVLVCHRNGVILRDLKLKRFYFVDEARTMLQYESLEGSMILDDPNDDLLSDKIGCPLYTAPELLCQNRTYRGKPADIWSLGVMLYTMLVGQYPFYERGGCNLLALIRHHNIQIPTYLSRSARRLISDLLHKNHMERITIGFIFLSPWLRDQGQFLMYVPVNGIVSEDEDDNNDEDEGDNINGISDINTYNDDSQESSVASHSGNEMS